ncbi:hypothetical protein GNI_162830 [Gregarina niphandrodes]|uniref:Uncharacterized protein n=1 Tax=Gregarina niphandrodes TaxID=110365 RepID=A0A023AZD5_GRENI|nr:hypothetical protein GNI_162830 [Gregarina niphandrodes]EZG43670.1 hypothetical protein GNI_162830 [Gregarina niphandrodes]|eukprot:XP_011133096.1 hypothetical protein GNI_162830 [Gregarina niphandrodes]
MAYVAAPLASQTILGAVRELEPRDFTLDMLADELSFFTTFTTEGLRAFIDSLEFLRECGSPSGSPLAGLTPTTVAGSEVLLPPTRVDDRSRISLLGYLLPFFIRRLTRLAGELTTLVDGVRSQELGGDMTPEVTDELRRLIQMVNDNVRPADPSLTNVLDMTRGVPWDMPDIHQKKALKWNQNASEIDAAGNKAQKPVRSTSEYGGRRQQRNPTGFLKFNIADLGLDDDSEDFGGLASGSPTRIPDGRTTDAPRRASATDGEHALKRQHSSFDDRTVEIEDSVSDPHWHDAQRASVREVRVRKRIPTGHPNMMATALLARKSLEMDSDEDNEDLATNTALNAK